MSVTHNKAEYEVETGMLQQPESGGLPGVTVANIPRLRSATLTGCDKRKLD